MTDERLELIIGNLLRIGVLVASAVVLAGGIWYLATQGGSIPDYHHFHRASAAWHGLAALAPSLRLVTLGLALLVLLPTVRVALALVAFALERDRTYVVCTSIVLAVLLYSLAMAWL